MTDRSTILIVDDEIVSRYTVEVLLESEGYQLIFAESGEEAITKAKQSAPDLMLLDVMMPGMNGFQVCQALRADPRLAELPIVMVTALDDRESRLKGIEVGADDFMSKPFDRAELRARIRTITRLNRYRRLVETEEHLAFLANYDPLTKLPNRSLFMERLQQAIIHSKRHHLSLAVLSLDLDGFKIINESLGHEFGDAMLCEIAQRIIQCLANGGTVARFSSDEFAILYECESINAVTSLLQQLLENIGSSMLIANHEISVSACVGISLYPSDGEDGMMLFKNANVALSRAKAQGQNTYKFFKEDMNAASLQRLLLENQLRKVVSREELRLFFQPQVDLTTGRIVGVEALVRWYHPEQGIISPATFIPLAEESNLIISIGEWVLFAACQQLKYWQQQGLPPLRMSVNVSSRQCQQSNLLHTVNSALKASELAPQWLELELTETLLMQEDLDNKNSGFAMFQELRDLGVQLAVDDFGTGYSSLSYLKRFPVSTLKIDRSFVKDVCNSSDDSAITSAIVAMAHSLQLSVIAEGIETVEQMKFLKSLQCGIGQGFLFSRPISAEEMTHLLRLRTDAPYLI